MRESLRGAIAILASTCRNVLPRIPVFDITQDDVFYLTAIAS
ncbi:MAG: hypothetical protein V7K69_00735 [Nostoc sp.]